MENFIIFDSIYSKNFNHFYKLYDSYLDLNSATIYPLNEKQVLDYIKSGYKRYYIDGKNVLTKSIIKL